MTEQIKEVLVDGELEGTVFRLPDQQLERPLYLGVAKALEGIGGKWNRKHRGFVFPYAPDKLMARLYSDPTFSLKQKYQFFPTPYDVAVQMAYLLRVEEAMLILEPSAGQGHLLEPFRQDGILSRFNIDIECCEVLDLHREMLKDDGYAVIADDFLTLDRPNRYDAVIANPPFSRNQDIDHIRKMYEVCKPGGEVVTLASPSWTFGNTKNQVEFRDWLKKLHATVHPLGEKAFAVSGTGITPVLVYFEKPEDLEAPAAPDRSPGTLQMSLF